MKRVVVTGMAGITSLGSDWPTISANFKAGKSGIRRMDEWDRFSELNTRLGGPVDDFVQPKHWTRKQTRSMGRVSKLAVYAAERALEHAGLLGDERIQDGRMGVACGSSTGSTDEIKAFGNMLLNSVADGLNANSYIRMMPHTTAANISIFFGLKGRLIPTSSACTSGSQGIGYAYEAIKYGRLKMMLAGGADGPSFETIVATGANSAIPHHRPTPAVLATGDFVKIDFGAAVAGYHSDMTRTYVLGRAADWQREIYELVATAQAAGRAALTPDADLRGVDAAARSVIDDAGYGDKYVHGLGHGIGLQIHEAPGIGSAATGTLPCGAAVTVEPGVYLPGRGGVRIEDSLVVTDGEPDLLTTTDKTFTVI